VAPPIGGFSASLPITYKSIVPQGATIRGSIVWTPTSSSQSNNSVIYVGSLQSSDFTDTSAIDGPNPFLVPVSVTPYGLNGKPEYLNGDP